MSQQVPDWSETERRRASARVRCHGHRDCRGALPPGEARPARQGHRYRKIRGTRFALEVSVDAEQVRYDAASDGCFPLTTNDPKLTDTEVLAAYRHQPNLEKRHHELKSVQDAAPVRLKSSFRIKALFCCQFIALLTNCLIERELRHAMTRESVPELAPYHEQRACTAPTVARVYDACAEIQRHQLTATASTSGPSDRSSNALQLQ